MQFPETPYADMTDEDRYEAREFARSTLRDAYRHEVAGAVEFLGTNIKTGRITTGAALDAALVSYVEDQPVLSNRRDALEVITYSDAGPQITPWRSHAELALMTDIHRAVAPILDEQRRLHPRPRPSAAPRPKRPKR